VARPALSELTHRSPPVWIDAELNKIQAAASAQMELVKVANGNLEVAGWFTSLWTLQEVRKYGNTMKF
jgi:hypothetical protein